jgi:hypothetical protein
MILQKREILMRRVQPDEAHPPGTFSTSVADPSIFADTQQIGAAEKATKSGGDLTSISFLYAAQGLHFAPAWNAIAAGLERLKELIYVNPRHVHPFIRGANGEPLLAAPHLYVVESECPNLVREIMELRQEVLPTGGTRYVGEDHALDCLRYIANSQPRPPEVSDHDLNALPTPERKTLTTHLKWAKDWDRQTKKGNSNTWFKK